MPQIRPFCCFCSLRLSRRRRVCYAPYREAGSFNLAPTVRRHAHDRHNVTDQQLSWQHYALVYQIQMVGFDTQSWHVHLLSGMDDLGSLFINYIATRAAMFSKAQRCLVSSVY